MKKLAIVLGVLAAVALTGCEPETIVFVSDGPPSRPSGIRSITADEAVYLYWDPNGETNITHYRVYRGFSATGYFDFIGETRDEAFVDYAVINGETYYYAVSAVNAGGWESTLSIENVHDTPRPEGYDVTLYDLAVHSEVSGFDLDGQRRVAFDDPTADVFIDRDTALGVLYINAANLNTDLQDMGYTDTFDDITWSPQDGWSPVGWAQVIEGHTYVVWTDQDHYAKLRAVAVASTWARFDWAFQVDPGNPELVKPAHDSGYLRRPTVARSIHLEAGSK